jgi:phytoene dehydrogenase-like protein
MMFRPILLAALLVASPLAAAEALYKCNDAKGAVSIQSEPCPKGSTEVWKREATPDPSPSPEELAARAALAQAEAERIAETARLAEERRLAAKARIDEDKRLREAVADAVTPPPRKSECTKAHDFNDLAKQLAWLELTQLQRERMQRWVVEQCRDPELLGGDGSQP